MDTSAAHEIPKEEWKFFFEAFSRQHEGWAVTVEVSGAGVGSQVEARGLPLAGITVDADRAGGQTVSVMVAASPDRHVSHTVAAPVRIVLDQSGVEVGLGEKVTIESADGTTTVVRFLAAVLPEQLDGIV